MFPDIGEVNKHQQLWISEWGVRPWSFLLCARHCYVHEMQMKRYCLWEEMSSGTVLGDISPECSFPVLLYFNKVVSAREEAVWVFPPKVLGLEGQRAVRNMDGPLSSGKRSVPVAMMWKITPVGKLQGPRRVAGWCQTDRREGHWGRSGQAENRSFTGERGELGKLPRTGGRGGRDLGFTQWGADVGRQVQTRPFLGTADELMLGVKDWVLGWDWREQTGEEPQRCYEVGWDPKFLRLLPCWKNWDLKRWIELGI